MTKKHKQKKEIIYLIIIVLLVLYITISNTSFSNLPSLVSEQKHTGYSKVSVNAKENIIILTSGCRALVMVTSRQQTNNIKTILENLTTARPLIHDVVSDIIRKSTIYINSVRVEKLINNTYYANIYLSNNKKIDSRPSDAIAIALRTGAPIYVNKILMEKHGQNICTQETIEKRSVEL